MFISMKPIPRSNNETRFLTHISNHIPPFGEKFW